MDKMQGVIEDNEPTPAIWSREVFCALGEGDVDCVGILNQLEVNDFSGWLVVEQDIFPQTSARFTKAIEDQKLNREFLTRHGL